MQLTPDPPKTPSLLKHKTIQSWIYTAECIAAFGISRFIQMYSIFDYHHATVAEFKAWIDTAADMERETVSTPPVLVERNERRRMRERRQHKDSDFQGSPG